MKVKRMISIIMAILMVLSAFPVAVGAQAIPNNLHGIQIPDGFSVQYIGRYHEASPVINGMIAVSSGESRTVLDKPVWGFVNAETRKEVISPQYTHDGYAEIHDGFSDFARYPRYFGNRVVLRDGLSATVFNKQGETVVPYGKYRHISVFFDGYAEIMTTDGKWGIINEEGKEMFPPGKYTPIHDVYVHTWGPSGIIPVLRTDNNLTTAINVFGKELVTPSDNIGLKDPSDGLLDIWDLETGKDYVIDSTGKKLFTHERERVLFGFSEGISFFQQFKPNSQIGVEANYLYGGFIDTTGKEVFRLPKGHFIHYLMQGWYENGLIKTVSYDPTNPIRSGNEHLLDITGKEVFETYGFIDEVGNGLAQVLMPVVESGEYGGTSVEMLYNLSTGKNILPEGYRLAGEIGKKLGREVGVDYQAVPETTDDLIAIIEAKDYDWSLDYDLFMDRLKKAYINANGDIVVPPGKYKRIEPFTHGKGRVQDDNLKWGFVDTKGNEIIKPQFDVVTYFIEDKAVVGIYTNEKAPNAGSDYLSISKPAHEYMTDWYILIDEAYTPAVKAKSPATTPPATEKAVPTASTVLVDGTSIAFEAYNIKGSNYFKLRDLAQAVNNTEKSFEVTWDGAKNAINLISNKAYTPAGGELAKGDGKAKAATLSTSEIYKDGKKISLAAYTINGNNYFKLRDIAKAFDIGVTWDGGTNTVGIDTSISYVEK